VARAISGGRDDTPPAATPSVAAFTSRDKEHTMTILLALIIGATVFGWVWIFWYMRASARTFDRQLNRLIWPLWRAAHQRGDDPLEQGDRS
jgi:hypothetical protein